MPAQSAYDQPAGPTRIALTPAFRLLRDPDIKIESRPLCIRVMLLWKQRKRAGENLLQPAFRDSRPGYPFEPEHGLPLLAAQVQSILVWIVQSQPSCRTNHEPNF